ncbi:MULTISPECIES: hypothetical protein [unclassified Paenibacillus]|uniref:hypothetical protein n=1 Tax=unclassified Paenibacillus TaxID=185978 RepID=UPI0030FC5FC0
MNDKCIKCDGGIYESEFLSRCLRCRKVTTKEISGEEYFKNKQERCKLTYTAEEGETVCTSNDETKLWDVFTLQQTVITKLRKAGANYTRLIPMGLRGN